MGNLNETEKLKMMKLMGVKDVLTINLYVRPNYKSKLISLKTSLISNSGIRNWKSNLNLQLTTKREEVG